MLFEHRNQAVPSVPFWHHHFLAVCLGSHFPSLSFCLNTGKRWGKDTVTDLPQAPSKDDHGEVKCSP